MKKYILFSGALVALGSAARYYWKKRQTSDMIPYKVVISAELAESELESIKYKYQNKIVNVEEIKRQHHMTLLGNPDIESAINSVIDDYLIKNVITTKNLIIKYQTWASHIVFSEIENTGYTMIQIDLNNN